MHMQHVTLMPVSLHYVVRASRTADQSLEGMQMIQVVSPPVIIMIQLYLYQCTCNNVLTCWSNFTHFILHNVQLCDRQFVLQFSSISAAEPRISATVLEISIVLHDLIYKRSVSNRQFPCHRRYSHRGIEIMAQYGECQRDEERGEKVKTSAR
jgi:hypothetical protein